MRTTWIDEHCQKGSQSSFESKAVFRVRYLLCKKLHGSQRDEDQATSVYHDVINMGKS